MAAKRGPGRPKGSCNKTTVIDATTPNHMRKPCPVPGCKEMAAPRHHMVCKAHGALPGAEIAAAKFTARQPGGVWYKAEGVTQAAKKSRRKASAVAA